MDKFRTGNIVKLASGSIVIIKGYRTINLSKESYRVVDWISFNYSNCSGGTREFTYESNEMCWECNTNVYPDYPDDECKNCKGTGYYTATILGMDKSTILADCAKKYIMDRLTVNFDF